MPETTLEPLRLLALRVRAVLDARRRRETELSALVDTARNLASLHVHVNTVAQRLERVARLLGESWAEPSRALELRLHRLSAR